MPYGAAMDFLSYESAIALRDELDAPKRGLCFEQIVREILPWSYRPPIAVKGHTEQLDAFFEWNSWHFLVECKAKQEPITAGSHDWEDFELKLRRRSGYCIGLFCSLWEVHDGIYERAKLLNEASCTTIVVAGEVWDQLLQQQLQLESFLRYMIFQARSTFSPKAHSVRFVKNWIADRTATADRIGNLCQSASATFLRRHRLTRHHSIYISRGIDKDIADIAATLRPSRLKPRDKFVAVRSEQRNKMKRVKVGRTQPAQVMIIKDKSGSGKTTLSVQTALERDRYFGVARAALEPEIDNILSLLNCFGQDCGISELELVDRPIVYVIDSLDEASAAPQKRKEIRSLFECLNQLNNIAYLYRMVVFPILFVFTVRDDFWREWESSFEGRRAREYVCQYSLFSGPQTKQAIEKYSTAYDFRIERPIDEETLRILSHPFSLQVFAEANEYRGIIEPTSLLSHNVMVLYFERKKEDVLKRPVPGFQGDVVLDICSEIAMGMLSAAKNEIAKSSLVSIIATNYVVLARFSGEIANSLVSEQILVRDPLNAATLRFRHIRFIEYLIAYQIAKRLHNSPGKVSLDQFSRRIFDSQFVSIYYIHDFIKKIAETYFPDLRPHLEAHYSKDKRYMSYLALNKRLDISQGHEVSQEDIRTIHLSMVNFDSELCWDSFFVIAAKPSNQSATKVLQAFEVAWDANRKRDDRWKMLTKLREKRLLLNEAVFVRVMSSISPKEWEVYLEEVGASDEYRLFPKTWECFDGETIRSTFVGKQEWGQVLWLLKYAVCARRYPPGGLIY